MQGLDAYGVHKRRSSRKADGRLEKGWKSGEEEGWLSLEEVETQLGINKPNEETEAAMLEAERIARDESVKGCDSMDELFAALKR